jgi:hypothetical protein
LRTRSEQCPKNFSSICRIGSLGSLRL